MEKKCGICQRNKIENSARATLLILPVAAVQPISGGIAPGTAPISVHNVVRVFSGVYTKMYALRVNKPSAPVRMLTKYIRYTVPAADNEAENINASVGNK